MDRCLSIVLLALLAGSTVASADQWEPPASPDPKAILGEARYDRSSGRYAVALEKHVWFHENALDIEPALTGVRLSFALFDWRLLGHLYPPALERLEAFRDSAGEAVKNDGYDFRTFHDFQSINRVLEEDDETIELFKWLDAKDPAGARSAYIVAEEALVAAGEFALCGKYIDGIDRYFDIEYRYRLDLRAAKDGFRGHEGSARDRKVFSYDTALLVALLVKNDRSAEAEDIADRALRDWAEHLDSQQILDAKKGVIPARR